MPTHYYNEIDPFAAAWLREVIKEGLLPAGDVDERSIEDVAPDELAGYRQCHFFAGIGIWPLALRLAGWPDDRPIWTGSCPCQPFSAIGKGGGFADERHLWPAFDWLIGECRPAVVVGEQVASPDGLAWIDLVLADLEGAGYAVGAVDTCAAGFGAPHIRQRLFWVGHAVGAGLEGHAGHGDEGNQPGWIVARTDRPAPAAGAAGDGEPGAVNSYWRDADWLRCRDDKWRPVEPGTFPLVAAGSPRNRVGTLRGAGNSLNVAQAQGFIEAVMETL